MRQYRIFNLKKSEGFKVKNVKIFKTIWSVPIALAVTVAGCAVPDQPYYGSSPTQAQTYQGQAQSYQVGVVDRIEVVNRGSAEWHLLKLSRMPMFSDFSSSELARLRQ